jgi:anti-sigma factor RsiW
MKCEDVRHLLHPYSDGELDLVRHLEIERHLAECAECSEQEKNLRSLRVAVSSPALYHRAPTALRSRIQLASAPVSHGRRRSSLQFAAIAAGLLLVIGISATIGFVLSNARHSADDQLAERVVAGHVRSLQADHLRDVVSSNQHKVKPWFGGKLDFSPQVPDLTAQGYELSGGRLDYLTDRPVAALVYLRHDHAINVFSWPATSNEDQAVRRLARQGFHIRSWRRSGITYWAISELNDQELDEFVQLFQERTSESNP